MANRIALGASALLAAALAVAAATPARAQCRLCTTPTTAAPALAEEGQISLSVSTTLDFDRLVLRGAGEGSATLLPKGDRRSSGSIAAISARATVGSVMVRGEPGRAVRVELPSQILLHTLTGASVTVVDIATDLADEPRLDADGTLSFDFGGRLTLTGDSDGDYRGELPITVEYLETCSEAEQCLAAR